MVKGFFGVWDRLGCRRAQQRSDAGDRRMLRAASCFPPDDTPPADPSRWAACMLVIQQPHLDPTMSLPNDESGRRIESTAISHCLALSTTYLELCPHDRLLRRESRRADQEEDRHDHRRRHEAGHGCGSIACVGGGAETRGAKRGRCRCVRSRERDVSLFSPGEF